MTRVKVALVAGGGAVKAYTFHLGVLRGMQEDGFAFRGGMRWQPKAAEAGQREIGCYVGSSAGACVVASLAAGHPPDQMHRALLGTAESVPKFGYRTLFQPIAPNPLGFAKRALKRLEIGDAWPHQLLDVGAIFTAAGVERYFRRHVLPTNRFADLGAELYLVTTQVNGARKVIFGPADSLGGDGYDAERAYYDNVPISQALAAAVSVPPVFSPYGIVNPSSGERFHYYDGEVREPLSLHVARDAGARFVIASSIWSPQRFDPRIGSLGEWGMSVVAEQALHQMIGQKILQDRLASERHDRLLELLEDYGGRHGIDESARAELRERVCRLLQHRSATSLYVSPLADDGEFIFHGAFRFSRKLIDRCMEAGYRAYRQALSEAPAFLPSLDAALREAETDEPGGDAAGDSTGGHSAEPDATR